MKLPRILRIGHLPWRVVTASRKEAEKMGAPAWCDNDTLTIALREDLPPPVEAECLVHEVLHAALEGVDHGLNDDQEERLVTGLAPVLTMIIRDQPELFAQLASASRTLPPA